jgi:ADP-ribose pyrophosphatase
MKLEKITKVHDGAFISRYDLTYTTVDDKTKVYEMISRDKELDEARLHKESADAVVIIAFDENEERILLNKEFRLAVDDYVYNFPAGLVDPGEDIYQAAKRELWEETGLDLCEVIDTMGISYSAVGFSNEINNCIVCKAKGTFAPSTSTVEEIEAAWYTKEEIRELLKKGRFAARTQAFCYMWSRS